MVHLVKREETMTREFRVLLSIVCLLVGGCAAEDERIMLLRHAHLTLPEATSVAEKSTPGSHAVQVELRKSKNDVIYEVHIVKTVSVDALDGHIIPSDEK
jgi:uncharacterized membrane protein YkoI